MEIRVPPVSAPALGVYVHVPFCAARCHYCDFATWTDRSHLVEAYVDACVRDVGRRALPAVSSVFFGGGTPSLLPAPSLVRILDAIPRTADAEVTVECNPDSVDAAKLAAYAGAGVNRVSFGVQSMRAHVLAALGRTHDPANVARAVAWARAAGISDVNLDLIYGTPGERAVDWAATLDLALALEPTHVSAYALTVEAGTPLARMVASGERDAPDDDEQAARYEVADDRLAGAGYQWYEISNWARPGRECRHNLLYWAQGDYAAIGCAAHGHRGGHRWWNVRTPERYITAVDAGVSPVAGDEHLDPAARAEERWSLALRTRAGIDLGPAARRESPGLARAVDGLVADGLLDLADHGAVLTRRGRLLANEVWLTLSLAGERAARSAPASPTR